MALVDEFPWLEGAVDVFEGVGDWAQDVGTRAILPYLTQGVGERSVGQLDAAATMAQNMATMSGQGLGALATAPVHGLQGATQAMERNLNNNLVQPRTQSGQQNANTMAAMGAPVDALAENLGDAALESTNSPEFATAAYMAPYVAGVAGGRLFGKSPKQYSQTDLFPDPSRIAGKGPTPRGGVTGRGGPGARQEGAIKIEGPAGPGEKYKLPEATVPAVATLYDTPKIDESGRSIDTVPNQPRPERGSDALFTSGVPDALRWTQRKSGSKEDWVKDLKRAGVDESEMRFTGVMDALNSKENISREDIVEAYNEQGSKLDLWTRGGGVKDLDMTAAEVPVRTNARALNDLDLQQQSEASDAFGIEGVSPNSMRPLEDAVLFNNTDDIARIIDDLIAEGGDPQQIDQAVERISSLAAKRKQLEEEGVKLRANINEMQEISRVVGPGEYSMSGISPGGEIMQRRYSVQQPRDLFDTNQGNLKSHWPALNTGKSLHLMHGRESVYPVFSDSPFEKVNPETGETDLYRPTLAMGIEQQSDPAQQILNSQYKDADSGFRRDLTPMEIEEAKGRTVEVRAAANAEIANLRPLLTRAQEIADELRARMPRNDPSDLYNNWPGSWDAAMQEWAASNGYGDFQITGSTANDVAVREAFLEEMRDPDSEADLGPETEDERATFIEFLENMDDWNYNKKNWRQATRRVNELESDVSEQNRIITNAERPKNPHSEFKVHENTPFMRRNFTPEQIETAGEDYSGPGRTERWNADYGIRLENAITAGDEYMATIPQRLHGESYSFFGGYREGDTPVMSPDQESMERFARPGPTKPRRLLYDSRYDSFMVPDRWGDFDERANLQDFTEDEITQARDAAPDYNEYAEEGRERIYETRLNQLENGGITTRNDGSLRDRIREYLLSDEERADVPAYIESQAQEAAERADHWDVQSEMPESWDELQSASAVEFVDEPEVGTNDVPWDEPVSLLRDPESSEWGKTENAQKTKGASTAYYADSITKSNQRRFLRGLGLTDKQIGEALTEVETGMGWGYDPRDGTKERLYGDNPPRKVRVKAIKITPAVKAAWEDSKRAGGLFGRGHTPKRTKREERSMKARARADETGKALTSK